MGYLTFSPYSGSGIFKQDQYYKITVNQEEEYAVDSKYVGKYLLVPQLSKTPLQILQDGEQRGMRIDSDGNLTASNVALRGRIDAESGTIGGMTITDNGLSILSWDEHDNPI